MIRYCTELQSVQYLNPHAVSVQEEEHMKSASDVPGSMAHVLLVRE